MKDLDALFSPKYVAVVGASNSVGKVGHDIFANILSGKFTGTLFPVNTKSISVCSVKAYSNILDIPYQIDLAIIILPPKLALKTTKEAINKGVKSIVIVSAGFREVGFEGADIENKISRHCKIAGVRLVGPNCLGVINPIGSVSLNASFSKRMPSPGNVSFISQSGALCSSVLDFAEYRNFGFSKFISIGNKADVDELDLLKYFHSDPDTDVILLYLEELNCAKNFVKVVSNITGGTKPTPILVVKSGRTKAGANAALSHTGSLAGSEDAYEAIFSQSGIIRVDSINDLFDLATAFVFKNKKAIGKHKRKVPYGNKVCIVTNAGGPGIIATDMTVSSGLKLSKLSTKTVDVLKSHLPFTANVNNPVDIIGDAADERYYNALSTVIKDSSVDGVLVILTPQSMTDAVGTARIIVEISSKSYKPIICCFMGVVDVSDGVKYLQKYGVPVYPFPENAAKALGSLYKYSKWLNRQEFSSYKFFHNKKLASHIIKNFIRNNEKYIGEFESRRLLKCYGFNILPAMLAKNKESALKIASKIGTPVAMKIQSPNFIHKTEANGVLLDVNINDVEKCFDVLLDNARKYDINAKISGVLIQKMSDKGQEVIVGMNRDKVFGPLLMFGIGGTYVEIFKDVNFRLAPLNREDSRFMVRNIRGFRLLDGFRGIPRSDIEKLEEIIVRLSDLVVNHTEIAEIDINPLIVHESGKGVTVADCRIILR